MSGYDEDGLVQQTIADVLEQTLGWESVFAYNQEGVGPDSLLGRKSQREVVLTRYLRVALEQFNPSLPNMAYDDAIRQIVDVFGAQSIIQTNQEKYHLIRDGVTVRYRQDGERKTARLKVFDYNTPVNNHFLCVRELWIDSGIRRRRADIVGFVNGLPLMFIECKRPGKDLRYAYEDNFLDYMDTIKELFFFNAFVVLSNGKDANLGSITAKYEHFKQWKRLSEFEKGTERLEGESLILGLCDKANFMDMFENFVLFDESGSKTAKIVARNHQFLGVNRAITATRNIENAERRLGVFWHTQGSGKSYSMALYAQKVHRKLGGDYTFLVMTDRTDLDDQIYKTFAGVGLANNDKDPCRAGSGGKLKELLGLQKKYVFGMIQKFNQEIEDGEPYSDRSNIIVMTDEAHRTQYGSLALNMRDALPNASFIGFTGTPLMNDDETTQKVFGKYVSTYGFKRAVDDGATVPLFYDARGEKLDIVDEGLNEKLAEAIANAEITDVDVSARLERDLKREYHIRTADKRLTAIAEDFAEHYSTNWESGKAMFVALDKPTTVKMYGMIQAAWQKRMEMLRAELEQETDTEQKAYLGKQVAWMAETEMAVVVSDEQGEVEKFRKLGLEIDPHRKRMREGFVMDDGKRADMETAFKKEEHPFRVVFVCAMWLTGFDVPSLATLYLDKPLKAHTLMQAIARANRVHAGKENGLIVDYGNILKNLRKALATFAGIPGTGDEDGSGEENPANPSAELLGELAEAIAIVREQLSSKGFELSDLHDTEGFKKLELLALVKNLINENDETRKRFELSARTVFRKYKAALTVEGVKQYRRDHQALNYIYNSLDDDRKKADISEIMASLQAIVHEAVIVRTSEDDGDKVFDISKIDFESLQKEFAKRPNKNTDVQNMKEAMEQRLARLIMENPLNADFQERFNEIIKDYNKEKDRKTIEATFEALTRLMADMEEAEREHTREGLSKPQKAVFDILRKPELEQKDIHKIKSVAVELLQSIRSQMENTQDLFAKEATRDGLRQKIYDALYDEDTGLPVDFYPEDELDDLTDSIFAYVQNREAFILGQSHG